MRPIVGQRDGRALDLLRAITRRACTSSERAADRYRGVMATTAVTEAAATGTGATPELTDALRTLAARLSDEIPAAVERGLALMRAEVPGFFARDGDPDFVALYRGSYVEQLRAICAGLARRPSLAAEPLSPAVAEEVRAAAALGIPLGDFLRVCRIGHRVLLDDAIALAHATFGDRDLLVAVVRAASDWLFEWFDWLTARETEAYERERDLLVRDRARRRGQLVRALLDGEPVDGGELGYELRRTHLAVVAWGERAACALCDLSEATGLELLDVAGTGATAWGWLGGERIGPRELGAVRAFAPAAGTWLAVGEPGAGADGFRASHRQALSAYRIARERPAPVTLHADVALLALALQDPSLAREFVARELGPLAAGDERVAVLRETLAAYFAAGQNAASAAAALGVHNRTVLYRLRSIEERLGHPIAARREELAVALRLLPAVADG
jgi:hypothetical protein